MFFVCCVCLWWWLCCDGPDSPSSCTKPLIPTPSIGLYVQVRAFRAVAVVGVVVVFVVVVVVVVVVVNCVAVVFDHPRAGNLGRSGLWKIAMVVVLVGV